MRSCWAVRSTTCWRTDEPACSHHRHHPDTVADRRLAAQVTEHDPEAVTRHDLDNLEKAMQAGFKSLRDHVDTRFTSIEDAAERAGEEIKRRQVEMNQFRDEARKDAETYVRLDLYRTERNAGQAKLDKVEEKIAGELRGLRALIGSVALLLIATLAGVVVDIASR